MASGRLAKAEIDAVIAHQRVMSRREGHHAVVPESGGSTPHDYVAVLERHARNPVRPAEPAEQKTRWDAERHGDDRLVEVPFVLVLVQGQSRTRLVAVDEAGVGYEAAEAGVGRSILG